MVSTARMTLLHELSNAGFHLIGSARFRGMFPEQSTMNVFGGESTRAPDDDFIAFFVPFKDGSGTDSKFAPNVGGNRDLALGGELGVG